VLRLPATRSSATVALFAPNLRTGYAQQYSFTLQRELFRSTVIEAGYVGMRGVKLFMELDLNQPRIYEDFLAAFRELQSFRASGAPGSASNTLVRMFGSATSAIAGVGASNRSRCGGSCRRLPDRTYYTLYSGPYIEFLLAQCLALARLLGMLAKTDPAMHQDGATCPRARTR
jgi:hypothetical protein